jgi:transposase
MAQLAAVPIELTEEQRQALEAIVRKYTSPYQLVIRARIVLLAAQGHGVRAIATHLHIARGRVQSWRRRWLTTAASTPVARRLADLPRPGAPATYTPEQICAIVALSCESPEASGRPISHWTQQELADEAVKRGLVTAISQRSVGRFLKRSRPPAAPRARLADARAR